MPQSLTNRRVWVFDLDNTLYPPHAQLFEQINTRMSAYIMQALGLDRPQAEALRYNYWQRYGTTLAGLMQEHGLDPNPYLVDVHDISFDVLAPDPGLRHAIDALPGRRIVYTNGSAPYAEKVLAARGLLGIFHAVYGVEHAGYHPKPQANAFQAILKRDGIHPDSAVMFEDDVRNLRVPHDIGMATVHVAPDPDPHDHIHHHTDNLAAFLGAILDPAPGTSRT